MHQPLSHEEGNTWTLQRYKLLIILTSIIIVGLIFLWIHNKLTQPV